jgi:hypothetical protein
MKPTFNDEKELIELLAYSIKVLYQNVASIEGQKDEFNRKKNLIFIL